MKKRIALTIAVGALVLMVVPIAFAGKPGGGGGGATRTTLKSSCNPCAFQTIAEFSGSGLDGSQPRGMVAVTGSDGSTTWAGINVNPDGTTSFVWYMSPTGTYNFTVYQNSHNKLVAKVSLAGVAVQ